MGRWLLVRSPTTLAQLGTMSTEYNALNKERQRLQASINYWTLQANNWQASTTKHAGNERRQLHNTRQLDYCRARLAESTRRHNEICTQITALDPQRSQQRRLNSLYSQLSHARTELAWCEQHAPPEAEAFWQTKITKLRNSVANYTERIQQLRSTIRPDRTNQLNQARTDYAEHLAIINEAFASTDKTQ